MRERLASGRARSDMLLAGAEAFGDPLGALLCRGLDNSDRPSLARAKWVLAGNATKRENVGIPQATQAAHHVIVRLNNQRCEACDGRRMQVSATGVYSACLACNATGLVGVDPGWWKRLHQSILIEALAAVGRHLARTRAQMYEF